MTKTEATAEVFLLAFRSLPKLQRRAVVSQLVDDLEFREDLIDIAIIAEREGEPTRPYEEFVEELRREGKL